MIEEKEQEKVKAGIGSALAQIPQGLFILTARHEDRRLGMLASWVQQSCFEPPMVSVAIAKGRPIMPLISESRRFGLCQIATGEKVILPKFAAGVDSSEDPLPACDLIHGVEGDHDIFIGAIKAGNFHNGEPMVHLREDGFSY